MLEILKGKAEEKTESEEEITGDNNIAPTVTEIPINPESCLLYTSNTQDNTGLMREVTI